MDYNPPYKFLNVGDYDYIVSIGNKCPTAIVLRELKIYRESFPFDYIPISPRLVLKYLQSQDDFYPKHNEMTTKDNVWFGHFNVKDKYDETIQTFKRRFKRLLDALQNKKKILFVYTSEADMYNEANSRYNDNYSELLKIVHYIIETYTYDTFHLLAIHTNKSFPNTDNMFNYTINVADQYMSDDGSTHKKPIFTIYRSILKNLLKHIFKL